MTTFVVPQAVHEASPPPSPEPQHPINVPLAVLESHVCTNSESSRYALSGVKFERDGVSSTGILMPLDRDKLPAPEFIGK